MNQHVPDVKGERVAPQEPTPYKEVDFDDGTIELAVSLEAQHFPRCERTCVPQPLKVVVEEVCGEGVSIDEDDQRSQGHRAGGSSE
jgi:hypothetical protein